jgi:hypothetical protein
VPTQPESPAVPYAIEADLTRLRVGILDAEIDAQGHGRITLDCREYDFTSLSIDIVAGESPRLKMTLFPFPDQVVRPRRPAA